MEKNRRNSPYISCSAYDYLKWRDVMWGCLRRIYSQKLTEVKYEKRRYFPIVFYSDGDLTFYFCFSFLVGNSIFTYCLVCSFFVGILKITFFFFILYICRRRRHFEVWISFVEWINLKKRSQPIILKAHTHSLELDCFLFPLCFMLCFVLFCFCWSWIHWSQNKFAYQECAARATCWWYDARISLNLIIRRSDIRLFIWYTKCVAKVRLR